MTIRLGWLTGLDPATIGIGQAVAQAACLYVGGLAVVRLAGRRALSSMSAFDVVVGILLGSVLSRAVNGGAPIVPTLAAAATIVGLHWLIARLAVRWDALAGFVKGRGLVVIEDGRVDEAALRTAGLGARDLQEALRTNGSVTDPSQVRLATVERSGQISVIPRDR